MNKRTLIKDVVKIRNTITNEINKAFISESIARSYWAIQKNRVREQYESLRKAWAGFILEKFSIIYKEERWRQIQEAKKQSKLANILPFRKELDFNSGVVIEEFSDGIISDLSVAAENGLRQQMLLLRLLELRNKQQQQLKIISLCEKDEAYGLNNNEQKQLQAFLEEWEIEDIIHRAESYPEARSEIIDRLMAESTDGRTVIVPTKVSPANPTGVRHYNIKYYTEMVMRTTVRELQTTATLNAAELVDADLVQVSSHNTMCDICIEFEGRIYSISGKSQIFPPLDDAPPYHPNCLHSITVIFEEVLHERGIQKYIDFNRGVSDIHPTVKNWIPISQRSIA